MAWKKIKSLKSLLNKILKRIEQEYWGLEMMDKKRVRKYLERIYSNLSQEQQKVKLEDILSRLGKLNFLDEETLRDVIQQLRNNEGWSMEKILAHLDLIDLDERT